MINMFKNLFEVQQAYYKNRMIRVTKVIKSMYEQLKGNGDIDFQYWKSEFSQDNRNYLEPTYEIALNNTWIKIIDFGLNESNRYSRLIKDECFHDEI